MVIEHLVYVPQDYGTICHLHCPIELYRELQKRPYCAFQKHADSKIQSSTDNVVGTVLNDLIR